MYVCGITHVTGHQQRSNDNLQESVLSFHYVIPGGGSN